MEVTPRLTVSDSSPHTMRMYPGPCRGAGGPVWPLLSGKPRPRVQSTCLADRLPLRGWARRWAALVSGGRGSGLC